MKKSYKFGLIIIGFMLCLSLCISASYAYYIFSVSQNGSNIVNSDCFKITFTQGNALNITNGIPLSDEEAMEETPFTFTIKNVCNYVMNYDINIETLNTTDIDMSVVNARLDNRTIKTLGSIANNDSSVYVNTSGVSSSKTIYNNNLKGGEEKIFKLRLWVDEDASISQSANKRFDSKVVVRTSLIPDYSEATLISGPLFNKAIKELAGDEPTQSNINSYNNLITGANYDPNAYPEDFNIYNYNFDDNNIKNIVFANSEPQESDNAVVVSTNDSDTEVLAWFDTDTLYLYSDANRIYMNENSAYAFDSLTKLQSLDLSKFNSSNVDDMSHMFASMYVLTGIDLSNLDTSNVTNMNSMFRGSYGLKSLDVSNFNTIKVTDMSYMFSSCSGLNSLDLSTFVTPNLTTMYYMFFSMNSLKNLNLTNFNTSKVVNMQGTFDSMNSIQKLDLSSFDTSNVLTMREMFAFSNNISDLNVSSFDTSKVKDMNAMFSNLRVTSLDLSSFDTSSLVDVSYMFASLYSIKNIYVSDKWDLSNFDPNTYIGFSSPYLVGGSGTQFNYSVSGYGTLRFAKIDCGQDDPGYFTYKGSLGDTATYCASLNN